LNKNNHFLNFYLGGVQTLLWDSEAEWLISGSFNTSIVVWDIGANLDIAVELIGHSDRVIGIYYEKSQHKLFTYSADGQIGIWPMNVKRGETPKWLESDNCQICHLPFFWNIRAMWTQKQIGLRQVKNKTQSCSIEIVKISSFFQHHCRKCGRAICDQCSQTRTALPLIGYESVQRVCNECVKNLKHNEY